MAGSKHAINTLGVIIGTIKCKRKKGFGDMTFGHQSTSFMEIARNKSSENSIEILHPALIGGNHQITES